MEASHRQFAASAWGVPLQTESEKAMVTFVLLMIAAITIAVVLGFGAPSRRLARQMQCGRNEDKIQTVFESMSSSR